MLRLGGIGYDCVPLLNSNNKVIVMTQPALDNHPPADLQRRARRTLMIKRDPFLFQKKYVDAARDI